jgi:VCBS repeat-containing protein
MSTTTYIALKNKLTAFANAHFQIKRIGFDYDEQSEDFYIASDSFPAVFVTLTNVSSAENVARFTVNIECLDLITQNRSNINFITSDCELILRDFHIYFRDGNETSIDVINEPTTTPLNNVKLDYCAGAEMSIEFEVDTYTVCAIPMGEIPEPTDNCEPVEIYENDILVDTVESGGEYRYETACEDVTYTVKYEDNTIIEQGSEPSGGSILVVVPNCPAPEPCDDGTVNVQKSDSTLISAVTVASGGTSNYQVSDSSVNVNASLLANVKATDTLNITVVDSTDTPISVTLSGGNKITVTDLPCASSPAYDGALPLPTGDSTDLAATNYRGASWLVLNNNNPFGNTNRFTDDLGTQLYVSGVAIDWQSFDRDNSKVLGWYLTPESGAYATIIGGEPFTKASLSGWYMPTIQELFTLLYFGNTTIGHCLNYAPFNYIVSSNATRIKSRTEEPSDTTDSMSYLQTDTITPLIKTQSNNTFLRRIYTLAELGL